jgi:hypothetical protein
MKIKATKNIIGRLNLSGKPIVPLVGLYNEKQAFDRLHQGLPVSVITKNKTSRILKFTQTTVVNISGQRFQYKYVLGYC